MADVPLDAYDAILQHIYTQTQTYSFFNGSHSTGVSLRIDQAASTFRTFPYNDPSLAAFETAVIGLNPEVAIKLRSATVQAAVLTLRPNQNSLFIDAEFRIQVIDTVAELPHVEKGQGAAFVRDERALVVWSDRTDDIIDSAKEFEQRLLALVWGRHSSTRPSSLAPSMSSSPRIGPVGLPPTPGAPGTPVVAGHSHTPSLAASSSIGGIPPLDLNEKSDGNLAEKGMADEQIDPKRDLRPLRVYGPIYDGLAVGLAFFFVGTGVRTLLAEYTLDKDATRFALLVTAPLFFFVSLFFCITLIGSISQVIGPVAQCHENSRYYSAIPPPPPRIDPNNPDSHALPHVTIQMPVYKESLNETIAPSVYSLQKAMVTYARQGGTSSIFICDDGMQLLSDEDRILRQAFYAKHRIGWVSRPGHSNEKDGFKRAGRFKKASNMNFCLKIAERMEEIIKEMLLEEARASSPPPLPTAGGTATPATGTTNPFDDQFAFTYDPDLEEKALQRACAETNGQAWAAGGRSLRLGEIILLVDSDTQVPEDCLRDAARELAISQEVAIIQHESDAMQVANHYFENAIAYFTRRVNKSITMACANGEIAPFVGHNAFLRWSAMKEAAFVDKDGQRKYWSEEHVSEDFDMAMRVQLRGYIVRWATYSNKGFKEGVSLSADDELNRWTKYSYGCNELLLNPIYTWPWKGPFAPQIRRFLWSSAPIHYKISMLAYMFSYYGIASALSMGVLNYILLGMQFHIDNFYMRGFELWLACFVLFLGAGNISFTIMEYRLGNRSILESLFENIKWLPFFFIFFGGLSVHLSIAILSHLFSINITWGATKKEVERSNFFEEVPKILKRFWFVLTLCTCIIAGMVILSTNLVPAEWQVTGEAWAVILPLALSVACHVLYPIVLNPWLMIFSY
ncbi:hypothetical protein PC9H_006261 [Pleurotus ostreatus]|uniref:Glycosyltransferase 2-like domain-containing protein n=1 Tax=Pleurotus ostreatus TaxID=5322 RepID=A0A8H6ZVW1_PLEOS|nr:uncharacterized protein PC9H_006261 [Pleurotus ostreatus]KAF7430553.1 hypothetical protein PC9H_006261 [Pleurotus ostreatus]KAJ8694839.1 hypothetical protein PTI98_007482 [Pleurotus ostreatus]